MSLVHPFLEQRIHDHVDELAGAIGLSVFRECADPAAGPFVRRIGENPHGIEQDEYIKRLGTRVVEQFNGSGLGGAVITFDEKASLTASADLVVKKPGDSGRTVKKPGLVVIFDRPPLAR